MGDFTVPARFFVLSVFKNIYAVLNILTQVLPKTFKSCQKRSEISIRIFLPFTHKIICHHFYPRNKIKHLQM